ncbi:MAG: type II toxin-antitoxin system RelE/ParE family toxin [Phycisphaerales bacterium]|nr:type II toxin-antitoxin system RelE/ParE family toxin [Phycisphaerales bacterium]
MKQFRVLVTVPAEAEIEEAYCYIRKESPANAAQWRAGLLEAAGSLRMFPTRCPLAPENGPFEFEIRQILHGAYRLLFAIQGDAVVILHVRHGARQWMNFEEVVPPPFM